LLRILFEVFIRCELDIFCGPALVGQVGKWHVNIAGECLRDFNRRVLNALRIGKFALSYLYFVGATRHCTDFIRHLSHAILAAVGAADSTSVVVTNADSFGRRLDGNVFLVEHTQKTGPLHVRNLIILPHHFNKFIKKLM